MDIIKQITEELKVQKWQVEAAVKLIDEGNTIPFISRYRKEVTGSLNDEQLRDLHERLLYLRNLEDKKEQVLKSIEEQGALTDEPEGEDFSGSDFGGCGGFISPLSPEEKDSRKYSKGKGIGRAGTVPVGAGGYSARGRGSSKVYL